jgi:hypothetical protein
MDRERSFLLEGPDLLGARERNEVKADDTVTTVSRIDKKTDVHNKSLKPTP